MDSDVFLHVSNGHGPPDVLRNLSVGDLYLSVQYLHSLPLFDAVPGATRTPLVMVARTKLDLRMSAKPRILSPVLSSSSPMKVRMRDLMASLGGFLVVEKGSKATDFPLCSLETYDLSVSPIVESFYGF